MSRPGERLYQLGEASRRRLVGVHPDLVRVVERAISLTDCDFAVIEGVRTAERQAELVAAGASRTLASRHLTGHAVDLGAYVGGRISWDWPLYHLIADAMRAAARVEKVPIRWGGVWDRQLAQLSGAGPDGIEGEVSAYVARRRSEGARAFLDGPHFELPRETYP